MVRARDDASVCGEYGRAAFDHYAGVAEVEVDALADTVAVVTGGAGHERVLRGVAGALDGHGETVEVVRVEDGRRRCGGEGHGIGGTGFEGG